MRLTIETKDKNVSLYNFGDEQLIANKLGKLENWENKLGIDLDILFQALENGCYVKHTIIYEEENRREEVFGLCKMPCVFYSQNNKGFGFVYGHEIPVLLKDYGKTWALTKEELL